MQREGARRIKLHPHEMVSAAEHDMRRVLVHAFLRAEWLRYFFTKPRYVTCTMPSNETIYGQTLSLRIEEEHNMHEPPARGFSHLGILICTRVCLCFINESFRSHVW